MLSSRLSALPRLVLPEPYDIGIMNTPVLQMKKLKPREVKSLPKATEPGKHWSVIRTQTF